MDKIRKITDWLWRNKERMVLVVMVLVFGFRVFKVVFPAPPPPAANYAPPRDIPTDLVEREQMLGLPPAPPYPPPPREIAVWKSIYDRNPFWYNAGGGGGPTTPQNAPQANIWLRKIQKMPNGGYRAQLQTAASVDWYDEGEQFEKYELISIDAEAGECVVFCEDLGTRVTLRK